MGGFPVHFFVVLAGDLLVVPVLDSELSVIAGCLQGDS